jgi:phage terminase large subunit-like protein
MGLRGARSRPYSKRLDMEGVRARELLELARSDPQPKKWRLPWMKKGLSRSQRVIAFCEDLTITSGTEAGEKLRLRDWQIEFIRAVYDPSKDGKRQVRTAVLSMGRKNGKTQLAAALALCHLCGPEAESRGEIYSCANDRFQASKIFHEMVALIDKHRYLTQRTNIIRFQKQIEDLENGSIYAALTSEAKTKMGLSPSFCVYDELGQTRDRELYDAMDSAMGARKEPLLLVISTQAADDLAPMSRLVDYGLKVQHGDLEDPSFHLTLYTAGNDADPWKRETWEAANPALGDFRSLEDVQRMAAQAQKMPTQESAFRNLILNQRVAAETRFIERSEWKACAGEVIIPDRARVHAALDLGSTRDMSALVLIHEDADGIFHVQPFYWLPGDIRARAEEDKVPYEVWIKDGLITAIGASTDPRAIAIKIAELSGQYRIMKLAFDRWRINDLKRELDAIGCPVQLVEHGQGYKDMSPAVDVLERMVVQRRLRHGGHPVLTWNAYNAVITRDPAGGRKLDKVKSIGRIDGLVALAMAFSLTRVESKKPFDVMAIIG